MPNKGKIGVVIRCPRCGEEWTPDANKWKNISSILKHGSKLLHCPFCNKLVTLKPDLTEKLLGDVNYGTVGNLRKQTAKANA